MDARRYLEEIVAPTIAEYEAEPTSVRRAFLACVAAFHTVDHLAHPASGRSLRQKFNRESSDFKLIDSIAHAFKHVSVGAAAPDHAKGLSADEVISRPPGFWDVAVWDLSRWDDPAGGVTLARANEVDLLTALRSTLAFLRSAAPNSV